jgi:hypothetical protein
MQKRNSIANEGVTGQLSMSQKSKFLKTGFHIHETDLWAPVSPMSSMPGGKGLHLLLAKIYGQRLGFDVLLKSRRH